MRAQAVNVRLGGRGKCQPCFQSLPLAAVSRCFDDIEADLCQSAPNCACHGERADARAGLGALCNQSVKIS